MNKEQELLLIEGCKEMALRFIAYNLRLLIYYQYAKKNKLNLWVRVDKN